MMVTAPVTMAVQGFQERIRLKIMGRLKRFVLADYFEAVKVCSFGEKRGVEECVNSTLASHTFFSCAFCQRA